MILIKLCGWVGTFSYLIGYFLLSIGKIRADKTIYHILNIIGAIGLTFNAFYLNDYPNVTINIIWAIIAAFAIVSIWFKRKEH